MSGVEFIITWWQYIVALATGVPRCSVGPVVDQCVEYTRTLGPIMWTNARDHWLL